MPTIPQQSAKFTNRIRVGSIVSVEEIDKGKVIHRYSGPVIRSRKATKVAHDECGCTRVVTIKVTSADDDTKWLLGVESTFDLVDDMWFGESGYDVRVQVSEK